jgi:Transcriptional regulator, AbiEi antitoxin
VGWCGDPLHGVIDQHVMTLAAAQHGAIAVRQLTTDLGRSPRSVSRARERGLLVDLAPGVVRLASSPETFLMRCNAAQLHAHPVGFLSGWTAARLYGLRSMPSAPVHLTVPTAFRRHPPDWVDLHVSSWYDETDHICGPHGLTIAHPMRMLWGLAAAFNQHRFKRAAEDAWHLRLITPSEAAEYLESHRCRGKDGVGRLEIWLQRSLTQDRPAQSNLERRLLEVFDDIGLPTPHRQHPVVLRNGETIHLDIAWPDIMLAVEPGAAWWHGGDLGMRRDQARDRACLDVGWRIIRFDESVRNDLRAAARQVARIHRQLGLAPRIIADSGP